MTKRDYYEILGVSRDASLSEIKLAYKELARKYHPDIASDKSTAEKHFREINEAYSILSDSEKRSRYDRFGHKGLRGDVDFGFGFPGFGDLGDIFDMFFDFGESRSYDTVSQAERGADLRYDLEITLEEAFDGVEKELNISSHQRCSGCKGTGYPPDSKLKECSACEGTGQQKTVQRTLLGQIVRVHTCQLCKGEGRIPLKICDECKGEGKVFSKRTLKVKIPPGVDSDSRIRIPYEGEAGTFGGSSGDLYIFLQIKTHKVFKRRGSDIIIEKKIKFTEAALGSEIKVPTLNGDCKLKIPAGAQSNTVLTLKGQGMPNLRGSGRGDQHIKIVVMIPTKLNKRQKELLKEFGKAGPQEADKNFFEKVKDVFSS